MLRPSHLIEWSSLGVGLALAALALACAPSLHGDDPLLECADDSLVSGDPGGNDSFADATELPLPALSPIYLSGGLALCPAGDVDVYRFTSPAGWAGIEVRVEYDPTFSPVELGLFDASANPLGELALRPEGARIRHAPAGAAPMYATVSAAGENNYRLVVFVTP
jgi:hypothetical protein